MSRSNWRLGFLLALFTAAYAADTIDITEAWIAAAPPSASVLAGYRQISNSEPDDMRITGFSSPRFGAIEMHRSVVEQGMASMQRQIDLLIPAGESLRLEPQALHLMLMQPSAPVSIGDTIRFTATLDSGREVTFGAVVRRLPAE